MGVPQGLPSWTDKSVCFQSPLKWAGFTVKPTSALTEHQKSWWVQYRYCTFKMFVFCLSTSFNWLPQSKKQPPRLPATVLGLGKWGVFKHNLISQCGIPMLSSSWPQWLKQAGVREPSLKQKPKRCCCCQIVKPHCFCQCWATITLGFWSLIWRLLPFRMFELSKQLKKT